MPDFSLERGAGAWPVAGVDEAGRGPLAGPVVAAAVVFLREPCAALAALLDDSKRLDAARRGRAFGALLAAEGVAFAIAAASAREIGGINILRATQLAMRRAVARLPVTPALVLVDGNGAPPGLPCPALPVVGGDAKSLSVAAASILAKVTRDRCMARLGARWPAYGFARHQGYPTRAHVAALAAHGPCPHHRRGFAPVERAVERALDARPPAGFNGGPTG